MSTTNESGIDSYKVNGIFDLKRMLKSENELTATMHKFGYDLDYDKKLVTIGDKKYSLEITSDKCKVCIKGKPIVCGSHFGCEFKDKLKALAMKLYYYDATTEFFISGYLEDMKQYTTISRSPEILYTLDEIGEESYGSHSPEYSMCFDWSKNNSICIIIEFITSLADMETFKPISKEYWLRYNRRCLYMSEYDDSDFWNENIPKRVFDNFELIRKFISRYYWGCNEDYGSLLSDKYVKPEQIRKIEKLKRM